MKLQQLRFLVAVVQSDLSITAAAGKVFATQPGISKQIKVLERELGFNLFVRKGRTLTAVTPAGQRVLAHALTVLREAQSIRNISADITRVGCGSLSIGTTHTQARYVLPRVIQRFRSQYPDVEFHLHQGTSEQIAEMARVDRIEFSLATGSHELFDGHVLLPWYRWARRIIVPAGHELAAARTLTLERLAAFPIVTYVFSLSGPASLQEIFGRAGLRPKVALTARDADVIKTYVRLGLGVGIVAGVALEAGDEADLVSLDASHLFPVHTSWIGFRRGSVLRRYMYDFLQLLGPHLTPHHIDRAAACDTQEEVDALFAGVELPLH